MSQNIITFIQQTKRMKTGEVVKSKDVQTGQNVRSFLIADSLLTWSRQRVLLARRNTVVSMFKGSFEPL